MKHYIGVNASHDGSVSVINETGKLVFHIEEERLTKNKHCCDAMSGLLLALSEFDNIECVVINSTNSYNYLAENLYNVAKSHPKTCYSNIVLNDQNHHNMHSISAIMTSPFKNEDVLSIVVDGAGSEIYLTDEISGYETESVFVLSDNKHNCISKYLRNGTENPTIQINIPEILYNNDEIIFNDRSGIVKCYEAVCYSIGYEHQDAGTVMGLSSYGNYKKLNTIDVRGGSKDHYASIYPGYSSLVSDSDLLGDLNLEYGEMKNMDHNNPKFILAADIAKTVQIDTQIQYLKLIEKHVDETGIKNVCVSGGYAYNTVANAYVLKNLPHINLHVMPIAGDSGISIGCAYHGMLMSIDNVIIKENINLLNDLFLGPVYNTEILSRLEDEAIQIELMDIDELIESATNDLIENKTIAWHNGRSEAGPRALGNRCLLNNPTSITGRSDVNKIKGREWYRPLAGSMLMEHYNDWFEEPTIGERASFMSYVVKSKQPNRIPAMVHVDDTCRIQTVTKAQNELYYKLINSFYEKTGIPMLLNTSYNKAGDPLCETFFDSIETFINTKDIHALYIEGYKITK